MILDHKAKLNLEASIKIHSCLVSHVLVYRSNNSII